MEISKECEKAFMKAKIGLMSAANGTPDLAFLSAMMLSLKFKWSDKIPTARTNGLTLELNPDYWMNICDADTHKGLIAHEVFHVALMHMFRRGSRDPKTWLYACDYVVNDMVLQLGLKLPPTDLIDSKYKGWTTEAVYDDLLKNNPPEPEKSFGDDISEEPDSGEDESQGSPSDEAQQRQAEVQAIVGQAHQSSKMLQNGNEAGYGSPELNRLIQDLFHPKLPWKHILRKCMSVFKKTDYSTRKFNKKFMPKFYLPTLHAEAFPDINVYTDTSGSVSDKDFKTFMSECQSIRRLLNPKYMNFFSWDHRLYEPDRLTKGMPITKVKMKGGGGTEVKGVLESIIKEKPEISIIFTDGYFSDRTELMKKASQSTKLFWLIYSNEEWTCPHGRVIHFDKDS